MKWIKVEDEKPIWGEEVLVFRGKIDHCDRWKFDNLPPMLEITKNHDSTITHWCHIAIPEDIFNKWNGIT